MDHLAIMKKSWGLTDKILSGQKKIESRWYSVRCRPWNRIKEGDVVYFKDTGSPVKIRAKVSKVLQFDNLTPGKVKRILKEYGKKDGIDKRNLSIFYDLFKDKRYCMLIFLKDPKRVKPFYVNKKGFGLMSAWITVKNINEIKI